MRHIPDRQVVETWCWSSGIPTSLPVDKYLNPRWVMTE